jgi:hypothetical protein
MDCHHFRKHHLAYLDDTLPGDLMAAAQRHVLACNGCAAHDSLVRRSLMVVHSLPTLEPSMAFQERLRARLAECRSECEAERQGGRRASAANRGDDALFAPRGTAARPARAVVAVAASAMLGVMAWQAFDDPGAPELVMQPVIASRPAPAAVSNPYLTPAMVQALSTGNPVWPAAMLIEDAPVTFVNTEYSFAEMR